MDFPVNAGGIGPLPEVVLHDPPVLQDVTNIAIYRHQALKIKREDPASFTDDEIGNIIVSEHHVVQRVAGEAVAPPWSVPLFQMLATMNATLLIVQTKQSNSAAADADDVIVPPKHGIHDPPANFTVTVGALQQLTGDQMIPIETYYGLPINPQNISAKLRRKRIAKAYGIIARTITVATPY